VTKKELKGVIQCVHKLWYGRKWTESPTKALELHRHMEVLFNFAEIKSTLVENNPRKMSPEKFKERTGATE